MKARSDPREAWLWPLLLVTALHLVSTAGAWWITDHGEILAVANRFMTTGHFDLKDLGPGWEDWTRIVAVRGSTETRFMPLSVLTLIPFLALDRLFGFRDPATFRFAHLQGHVFVTLGLALIGRFLVKSRASGATIALCVLLAGLNWPVWMVARRLGPEPVLFALMALFATGGKRSRIAALLLLPWVHASGGLLAVSAALWLRAEPRAGSSPSGVAALAACGAGLVSVAFLWNLPVHGHLLLGGYNAYAGDPFFKPQNPLVGSVRLLAPVIAWTLPLWILAIREARRTARATLTLWLPLVVFFGTFSSPEPERRLMPLLAAWTVTVCPLSLAVHRNARAALATLALISGVLGLTSDFVDTVQTPFGTYSGPILLLVRMAFAQGRAGVAALIALALLATIVGTGSRSLEALLGETEPGEGALSVRDSVA